MGDYQLFEVSHPVIFEVELDQILPLAGGEETAGHHEVLIAERAQHLGAVTLNAAMRAGSSSIRTVRSRLPPMRTSPMPSMVSRVFLMVLMA